MLLPIVRLMISSVSSLSQLIALYWFAVALTRRDSGYVITKKVEDFSHLLYLMSVFWFAPFSTPLSQSELKTRVAQDALLSSIVRVERKEYSVISGGQQLRIVELDYQGSGRGPDGRVGSVGLWHTAFNAEDGQTIYNLIQTAIQSGGRIQSKSKSDEAISQLERLAALHKSGDLTDDEFSVAKAKLLGL